MSVSAFVIFALLLVIIQVAGALADRGHREHLLSRLFRLHRDGMAVAVADGSNVIDLSKSAAVGRNTMRPASVIKTFLVLLAVIMPLFAGRWSTPATIVAALFMLAQGIDYRFLLEYMGVDSPDDKPTFRERVFRILAYGVKFATIFVGLLISGRGLGLFDSSALDGTLLMAAGLFLLAVSHVLPLVLLQLGLTGKAEPQGFGSASDEDSVLFLRSFRDDRLTIRSPFPLPGPSQPVFLYTRHRFEELLSRCLLPFNLQLVAIGRPNERFPELGAVRTYYPESGWRDAVRITAARCSAVVLVAGRTDNLSWEIEHLREWGVLEKALFILPPEPSPQYARDRLARLATGLTGTAELPEGWGAATWIAVRVRHGELEFFVADGRDWASYGTALAAHLGELQGSVRNLDGSQIFDGRATGKEMLPPIARMRIPLVLRKATLALESAYNDVWEKEIANAEAIARDSGVQGAVVYVLAFKAAALQEAGQEEAPWNLYIEVARLARKGFKTFQGLPGAYHIRASEFEIDALSELATMSAKSPTRDPRPIFVTYFEALERHHRWSDAAEIARMIGVNEQTRENGEIWFEKAVGFARRVGDLAKLAEVEQTWGKYLHQRNHPDEAQEHLETALRLYDQQEMPGQFISVRTLISEVETAGFRFNALAHRFSPTFREWLADATAAAGIRHDSSVDPVHFLLALEANEGTMENLGISTSLVTRELKSLAREVHDLSTSVSVHSGHDQSLTITTKNILKDLVRNHPETIFITPDDFLRVLHRELPLEVKRRREAVENAPESSGAMTPAALTPIEPERPSVIGEPIADTEWDKENDPVKEEARQWDTAVSWDFGWPNSPNPPDSSIRPPGLTEERFMPPRLKDFLQYLTIGIHAIPVHNVRARLLRAFASWLHAHGYTGTSIQIRIIESESLILARRFADSEALLLELLQAYIPGWLTFGDDPMTRDELIDKLSESLGELVWAKGAFDERVEIERRRLAMSSSLRDPNAPDLARASLAFSLAQAGRNEEAGELFAELTESSTHRPNVYLMYAANSLDMGDVELAKQMVAKAEERYEQNYPAVTGLKGDIARADGNKGLCLELYRKGLSEAIGYAERFKEQQFRRRLSQVRAAENMETAAD